MLLLCVLSGILLLMVVFNSSDVFADTLENRESLS